MDSQASNHENDAVFVDAVDDCPNSDAAVDDCPYFDAAGDDPPEPSSSTSTVSDPKPGSPEPRISHRKPLSPVNTLRRRKIRRQSQEKEPDNSTFHSSAASGSSDLIDDTRKSFRHHRSPRTPNEDENPAEKRDTSRNVSQQDSTFPGSDAETEEKAEESTVTTAANDEAAGDSADSSSQLGDSSSSFLELIAGLLIKAIAFQFKVIFMFVTFPISFAFHCCKFCVDPLGTIRRGKVFILGIFARACGAVFGCIEPYVKGLFRENDSVWSVAFRCGWGFLWSIYVCCILFGLLINSILFSGFLAKCFVEKPIRVREVLNFDYTKPSPVAYVPLISCDAVVDADGGKGSENSDKVSGIVKWSGERVIPSQHKVQVIVSLIVPESEYNRELGVFQARVDFVSPNGVTIASSRQPCMLIFRSEPIRLITTFLKIAPLIAGYVSETQALNIKMKGFVEGDVPTSCLRVTLEQRAEYQPGAGIPQIYDASLVIESELPFFKRIIWLWKMSLFVWVTMTAFVVQLLFLLLCCRPMIIPRTRQRVAYARGPATQSMLSEAS